jgi:hypothetical protein
MVTLKNHKVTNKIWICDIGTCGHYCHVVQWSYDIKDIYEEITVGNRKSFLNEYSVSQTAMTYTTLFAM